MSGHSPISAGQSPLPQRKATLQRLWILTRSQRDVKTREAASQWLVQKESVDVYGALKVLCRNKNERNIKMKPR